MSINRVILMGRLTADVELKQTQNGIAYCMITVAVNRPKIKDKEQEADFISVQAWRNTAEFISKYFSKGKMIIVEGSLRNNNYTDQNGVKHYSMVVQADSVNFGESKGNQQNNQQQQNTYSQNVQQTVQTSAQVQMAHQNTLDNFNTNYNMGDLSDFEVLSDGDMPF